MGSHFGILSSIRQQYYQCNITSILHRPAIVGNCYYFRNNSSYYPCFFSQFSIPQKFQGPVSANLELNLTCRSKFLYLQSLRKKSLLSQRRFLKKIFPSLCLMNKLMGSLESACLYRLGSEENLCCLLRNKG